MAEHLDQRDDADQREHRELHCYQHSLCALGDVDSPQTQQQQADDG